jgi:uncharacterized membrane protein
MHNPAYATDTAVPPTREFTAAWIAYGLFALGAMFWWPALFGALLCHIRHGARGAGFIDSHYSWLTRTFWWSSIWGLLCLTVILAGAWPILRDVLATVRQTGDWAEAGMSIGFDWRSIFMTAGAAAVGGIGIAVVWCWYVYRVLRGAFRLHDAQPAQ